MHAFTFKPKEFVAYMVYDKVNEVYVGVKKLIWADCDDVIEKIWFDKKEAMRCARNKKGRINFELHKFKLILKEKTNLEPIFVLERL
jgi:hypothetical protein